MRGNASGRRSAEFDALVSGGTGDRAAYADLLEVVAELRAVPPVAPRPEFVSSLRTQLVAAAERAALAPLEAPRPADAQLTARLTPRQRAGSRERRLAAVVGAFAVVSASGSMAMAAQTALPGDALYPMKRALENAQTNLQSDDAARAEILLAHAEARLTEAQELAAADAAAAAISLTLHDFTEQTGQAAEAALADFAATGDGTSIAGLRAFADQSMDVLADLGAVVPDEVRPALIAASQTLRQIDAAAWEACPTCAGGDIAEVPDFATIPLSAVLSGDIPGTASVTAPTKQARVKDPKPSAAPVPTDEMPIGQETPADLPTAEAPPSAPDDDEPVNEVEKSLRDLGIDGEPGLGPKPADGKTTTESPSLTGTLVDGVTGVVDGLL